MLGCSTSADLLQLQALQQEWTEKGVVYYGYGSYSKPEAPFSKDFYKKK